MIHETSSIDANPFLYIPSLDSAIAVTTSRFVDTFYTRLYNFSKDSIQKLPNDEVDVSPGSAAVYAGEDDVK